MSHYEVDIFALIRACAAGDATAQRQFQATYGTDIYYFPVKLHGLPLEKAGDFYVYAFEKDRIYSRLRTFAGHNDMQFRTFLSFFVLKSLFLDWLRTVKEVQTVSLPTDPKGVDLTDDLDESRSNPNASPLEPNLWSRLTQEERLDLKLLWLIDNDLTLEETRLLAARSGRSLRETFLLLEEVRQNLRRKDEKMTQLHDKLDSVWGWIFLRQKELQEIDEKIRHSITGSKIAESLLVQKKALEDALKKRYHQREELLKEKRAYKLTTPYSDIARLLNTTIGTVCARIFRLRQRFKERLSEKRAPEEGAL